MTDIESLFKEENKERIKKRIKKEEKLLPKVIKFGKKVVENFYFKFAKDYTFYSYEHLASEIEREMNVIIEELTLIDIVSKIEAESNYLRMIEGLYFIE